MTGKRYFLHKHLGRDVINDTLCHNWLKGEELEEHMNVQYTKYSDLKKENEQLKQDKKRLIGYLHRYGKVDVEDIDEVVLNQEYLDEWGELYGGDVE